MGFIYHLIGSILIFAGDEHSTIVPIPGTLYVRWIYNPCISLFVKFDKGKCTFPIPSSIGEFRYAMYRIGISNSFINGLFIRIR